MRAHNSIDHVISGPDWRDDWIVGNLACNPISAIVIDNA